MVAIKYISVDLLMWTFQSLEKVPPPSALVYTKPIFMV